MQRLHCSHPSRLAAARPTTWTVQAVTTTVLGTGRSCTLPVRACEACGAQRAHCQVPDP